MRRIYSGLAMALGVVALPVVASPCSEVVDDTVAEIRAGASSWWTDDAEGLVRAAAGAACVKARSGRYGATSIQEATVSAAGASSESKAEADSSEKASDDGSWSVGGLTFRSLGGSPGRKPYQRQDRNEED